MTDSDMLLIPDIYVTAAKDIAVKRASKSRENGYNPITRSGDKSGDTYELLGVIAEQFVVWQTKGIFEYRPLQSFKNKRDIGPCEVQGVADSTRNLLLRESDIRKGVPRDTAYILVQAKLIGNMWYAKFVGWMRIGDGLNRSDKEPFCSDKDGNVWLIRRELLRPMQELWDIYNTKIEGEDK